MFVWVRCHVDSNRSQDDDDPSMWDEDVPLLRKLGTPCQIPRAHGSPPIPNAFQFSLQAMHELVGMPQDGHSQVLQHYLSQLPPIHGKTHNTNSSSRLICAWIVTVKKILQNKIMGLECQTLGSGGPKIRKHNGNGILYNRRITRSVGRNHNNIVDDNDIKTCNNSFWQRQEDGCLVEEMRSWIDGRWHWDLRWRRRWFKWELDSFKQIEDTIHDINLTLDVQDSWR
ncbi:hypothetical protein JHK85_010678 [Glycine max]|nr:hypothetical protein JHK85_010678 [Glycine max]